LLSASDGLGGGQAPRALQALLGAVGLRPAAAAGTRLASYRRPELGRLFKSIRANLQASRHYVPQLYPGHVTFFQSDAGQAELNLIARWHRLAAGGASVYTIRGHHLDMLRQPHVAELAKRLEARLDQTQPDSAFDS
jgi:thioesterase domain-containing protein